MWLQEERLSSRIIIRSADEAQVGESQRLQQVDTEEVIGWVETELERGGALRPRMKSTHDYSGSKSVHIAFAFLRIP